MILSVLQQSARRGTLRGDDLRVLIEVTQHLDVVEFRRVKLLAIASPLHISEGQVSRALRRLVAAGCVARALDPGGTTYRLCLSLPPEGVSGLTAGPDLTRVQVVAPLHRRRRAR